MTIPALFYKHKTTSTVNHTYTPTGVLDVNHIIHNKKPWVLPTMNTLEPKKLVLADWTALNWSTEKKALVQASLTQLIDQGFSLFVSQDELIKPLSKNDLSSLQEASVLKSIHPAFPEVLINRTIVQHQLTRDEIFILDDYWLNHLLSEDSAPASRSVHLSDVAKLRDKRPEELVTILKHAAEPLTHIIFDELSDKAISLLGTLQEKLPGVSTKYDYHHLQLSSLVKPLTLQEQQLSIGGMIVTLEQLVSVKHLDVHDIKLSSNDINTLLIALPYLETLNFTNYKIGTLSLPSQSLPQLKNLKVHSSQILTPSLQALLDAAPVLETLTIDAISAANLSLAEKSLPRLEKLDLGYADISSENIKTLLDAAPALKQLRLSCSFESDFFIDESPHLLALEELELMSSISAEHLQMLLTQTSTLKKLRLESASNLGHNISLKPQCLIHLEELNLSETNLSSANLQVILTAAPNIRRLTLQACDNLQDDMNITEKCLKLEEIDLANSDVSTEFFSTLLTAAPNLKKLSLINYDNELNNLAIEPGCCSQAEELIIYQGDISSQGMQELLKGTPGLKKLSLQRCNLKDGDMILALKYLPHLTEVSWSNSAVSASNLSSLLAAAPALNKLNLSGYSRLDGPLSIAPNSLQYLDQLFLSTRTLSASNLSSLLAAAPALNKLSLSGCTGLDKALSIAPNSLQFLGELNLSECTISALNLSSFLAAAPAITKVNLSGCTKLDGIISITPKSLSHLDAINWASGTIPSPGLSVLLSAAHNVKKLDLSSSQLINGNIDIKSKSLSQLEQIDLRRADISIQSLDALLSASPSIKKLNLSQCQLDVDHLNIASKSLMNLEKIDANYSNMTTQVLNAFLAAAPNLKVLKLNGNSNITATAIERLHMIHPNIKIIYDAPNVSNQFDKLMDHPEPSLPLDPKHDAKKYKDSKPTPEEFEFKFKKQNKTKNQGMIIEKLCQYLTITQQHLHFIPTLQGGVCNALSHLFSDATPQEWSGFIDAIAAWNGKEVVTSELTHHFEKLWLYIQKFQLEGSSSKQQYLGTKLPAFLAENKNCILSNPWHAISLKPLAKDTWSVYDPNYVNGAREVPTHDLMQTIRAAIGPIVSAELDAARSPGIRNVDAFIERGGLLALTQSANVKEIMKALPKNYQFSTAALDGLFLRDTNGRPAWVLALNNPLIAAFTLKLLKQLKKENPETFQQQLQKSMEVMSASEKHGTIATLIKHATIANQSNTRELPPDSFSNSLITLIRTAPQSIYFEQRLKTWLKPRAKTSTLLEYTQHCLSFDEPKKRLIELNSTADVDALHFALENHAKNIHRPLYYIHSPDDLVCSAPFIERKDAIGLMKKGPGGPLHEFLTAKHEPSAPVLVINYENFAADDSVRLNALIDKERLADGTPLPEQALVIGLLNKNKPDCYTGSDFYSRFNQVETCPLSSTQLQPAIPQLPVVTPDALTEQPYVINLFHSNQWKEMMLGYWVLNGNNLTFHDGELAKVKGRVITIENGPWGDKEFKRFWQTACLHGTVDHEGSTITLPTNLQLVQREGYDWNTLKSAVHFTDNKIHLEAPIGMNPSRLNECFSHYEYRDADQSIIKLPGLIEAAQDKTRNLHLTRSISEDDWAKLLTECQQQRVTLNVFCAQGVELPAVLNPSEFTASYPTASWDGSPEKADQLINSTDVDTSVAMLTKDQNDWQVIDITECTPTDLLLKLDGVLDKDSLQFIFTQKEGALLKGLAANKRILLKGRFSDELADHLAPLLLERQRANESQGQLILVSSEPDSFQYLSGVTHEVSIVDKKACLGMMPDEIVNKITPFIPAESLSQLIARRDFWQAFPDKDSSDDAWIGMHHLPNRLQPLAQLDPLNSEKQAQEFIKARQDIVNNALQRMPYVLLTGLTGVGKSTFVTKYLAQKEDMLYQGEHKIKDWAEDTKTIGRKILFIDEATLSSRDWSEFEGLFEQPPGIMVDGTFYRLSPEHKVVFAGNPISYGDERQLASLFKRHGNAILFEPLLTAVLHHQIIKPVFANRSLEQQAFALSAHFLDVYRFLVDCSTTEVLVTPRELQMMALLTQSYCLNNPEAQAEQVARHYAYSLVQHLVPQSRRTEFDAQYKPEQLLQRPAPESARYTLTPSRLPMRALLDDLLTLRELKQQPGTEEQQYGGLGGFIIEGEPGVGKSELVIDTLLAHKFEEMHDFDLPATAEKPFYRMPVSMSLQEKDRLLRKAFDEGAVILIDEINSSPMIERLLNELLMGKTPEGNRPQKSGFMIIGTQNPVTMAGRRAPSTALSRRMITKELPLYPDKEMLSILIDKGISKAEANDMITAFNKNIKYATINHLKPIPCFRDLIELADELLRGYNVVDAKMILGNEAKMKHYVENDILTRLKFDTHLDRIKNKTEQFKGSTRADYNRAHNAAQTLHEALVAAQQTFLSSKDPINTKFPAFKKDCLDAISNSRPTLSEHRGWKIIISELVKAVVSILTLGAPDSKSGEKLFTFFSDIRTDAAKKLDDLQGSIEHENKQSNKNMF